MGSWHCCRSHVLRENLVVRMSNQLAPPPRKNSRQPSYPWKAAILSQILPVSLELDQELQNRAPGIQIQIGILRIRMLEGFVITDVKRNAIALVEPVAAADRRIDAEDVVQVVVMTTGAGGFHVGIRQARTSRQIEVQTICQCIAELQPQVDFQQLEVELRATARIAVIRSYPAARIISRSLADRARNNLSRIFIPRVRKPCRVGPLGRRACGCGVHVVILQIGDESDCQAVILV